MNGSFVCLSVNEDFLQTNIFIFLNVKEYRFSGAVGTSSIVYQL